jgi:hypothetical protein
VKKLGITRFDSLKSCVQVLISVCLLHVQFKRTSGQCAADAFDTPAFEARIQLVVVHHVYMRVVMVTHGVHGSE